MQENTSFLFKKLTIQGERLKLTPLIFSMYKILSKLAQNISKYK